MPIESQCSGIKLKINFFKFTTLTLKYQSLTKYFVQNQNIIEFTKRKKKKKLTKQWIYNRFVVCVITENK